MENHVGKPYIGVYQVSSSVENPITLKEIFDIEFEHFKCNPFIDNKGKSLISVNKLF